MNAPPSVIQVTAKHLGDGIVRDCCKCPVALAITEACRDIPGFRWVEAELDNLALYVGTDVYVARTPEPVTAFMDAFDSLADVGPFEFQVIWESPVPA